ncbi:lipoprotein [Escherichia phage vB_EcoS_bov15_1]|uniref:Lipoprotein n=1 Tax=Escherichia phage vb_EcoS_bov22_1 TaxID=2763527 RepID=A0AAE7MCN3_9CAUD|nr:lipoprotein [Escherichia phage vb_EcoS_bov22_1]QNR53545.1 lipoprotein [Escherichia phage vb_EcoS_bov11C2]QNR53619.1 lipoprotein [Escherichia phage vb_EcoS_bov16_1]QNR53755.1 lipoprotein [Escherichia phage vb_EcoS_bov25_1D]QOI69566.1 lipoprotein [Escherichia phage vB_EcoS_bov15_1]QNR53668.1 lipoprotein [Escherichia phage vb_EcoS_bov22_1]
MKTLIVICSVLLSGCAVERNNGDCITVAYGSCMLRYVDGQKVPAGDVDMRFTGLSADSDGNFSGTVSVKSREW